jgi:hypothetical protein
MGFHTIIVIEQNEIVGQDFSLAHICRKPRGLLYVANSNVGQCLP